MRRASLSFAVVLGALVAVAGVDATPAYAGNVEDAQKLVDEGKALFKDHLYKDAYTRFQAAHEKDAHNTSALYNAALAARKGGLLSEARVAYRELLQVAPGDLDAVYGLAEVERGLGNDADARPLYERYVSEEKRPERQDLVERARAALAALAPPPAQPTPSPALTRPAVEPAPPVAAPASAVPTIDVDAVFAEAVALQKQEQFAEAAARFAAVAVAVPTRFDAVLKFALMKRKLSAFDDAIGAYDHVRDAAGASREQKLDALYGGAEARRLKGDRDAALAAFRRYVAEEDRASEERFVARAKEQITALEAQPASTPTPSSTKTPEPAPEPAPTKTPEPASTKTLEPTPSTKTPEPTPATKTLEPPPMPASTLSMTAPPASTFVDDALARDLVERAVALEQAGKSAEAQALRAQAQAMSPTMVTSTTTTPCDVSTQLALGEVALRAGNAADALQAFRRARACAPERAAPLWGLSRAFDLVGAKKQARRMASLYASSTAPDRDPKLAQDASWRAAQPD